MGAWLMGGFCTGLRGEEMLLVDMLGTSTSVQRLMKDGAADPHFKFVIIGRTKGVQQDRKTFAISLRENDKRNRIEARNLGETIDGYEIVGWRNPWKGFCEKVETC